MVGALGEHETARGSGRVDFAAALVIGPVLLLECRRDCSAPDDPRGRGNQRLVPAVLGEVTRQLGEIGRPRDVEIVEERQDTGVIGVAHRLNPPSTIRVCPVT